MNSGVLESDFTDDDSRKAESFPIQFTKVTFI